MDKANLFAGLVRGCLAAFGAWLSAKFGALVPVMGLLFLAMAFDFYTGWTASLANGIKISSERGWEGIRKKTNCIVGVFCGLIVDFLILAVSKEVGIETEIMPIFGILVAIWLILNELISILENISRTGVEMPKFLLKIIEKLKIDTENAGGGNDE